MTGQELLSLSPEKQQEYVQNFKVGAYKSFCKVRDILSRPGVTFTPEQIELINNLSQTEKQNAIIGLLGGTK